ncbi:hypothetical protein DXA64_08420 [Collinsella sp. OF03-4AA]|nr:hypothetical protein DXA64_08420 [Collinsella sp. OF03-4AA]
MCLQSRFWHRLAGHPLSRQTALLDGRGDHGGDAGVGVLGVIDDRERDGGLRRLGLRRRLGSVLIVGLIVLGLVAKDIAVLERRRLGLVSGFFGCRLGGLVELRSGFLL